MVIIQYIFRARRWLQWKKRRDEAVAQLRDLLHVCFAGVLKPGEIEKWLSLGVLTQRNPTEWTILLLPMDPSLEDGHGPDKAINQDQSLGDSLDPHKETH